MRTLVVCPSMLVHHWQVSKREKGQGEGEGERQGGTRFSTFASRYSFSKIVHMRSVYQECHCYLFARQTQCIVPYTKRRNSGCSCHVHQCKEGHQVTGTHPWLAAPVHARHPRRAEPPSHGFCSFPRSVLTSPAPPPPPQTRTPGRVLAVFRGQPPPTHRIRRLPQSPSASGITAWTWPHRRCRRQARRGRQRPHRLGYGGGRGRRGRRGGRGRRRGRGRAPPGGRERGDYFVQRSQDGRSRPWRAGDGLARRLILRLTSCALRLHAYKVCGCCKC